MYKIKDLLGHIGIINIYKNSTRCRYNIRNKNDLRKSILPIFDKHPMLRDKVYTYFKFRYLLLIGCIYYEQIQHYCQSKVYKQELSEYCLKNLDQKRMRQQK